MAKLKPKISVVISVNPKYTKQMRVVKKELEKLKIIEPCIIIFK